MAGGIDTADIAYAYGTPVEAAAMGANEGFAASAFYSAVRTYHPMVAYSGKTTAAMVAVDIGCADIAPFGCRGAVYYNVRNSPHWLHGGCFAFAPSLLPIITLYFSILRQGCSLSDFRHGVVYGTSCCVSHGIMCFCD